MKTRNLAVHCINDRVTRKRKAAQDDESCVKKPDLELDLLRDADINQGTISETESLHDEQRNTLLKKAIEAPADPMDISIKMDQERASVALHSASNANPKALYSITHVSSSNIVFTLTYAQCMNIPILPPYQRTIIASSCTDLKLDTRGFTRHRNRRILSVIAEDIDENIPKSLCYALNVNGVMRTARVGNVFGAIYHHMLKYPAISYPHCSATHVVVEMNSHTINVVYYMAVTFFISRAIAYAIMEQATKDNSRDFYVVSYSDHKIKASSIYESACLVPENDIEPTDAALQKIRAAVIQSFPCADMTPSDWAFMSKWCPHYEKKLQECADKEKDNLLKPVTGKSQPTRITLMRLLHDLDVEEHKGFNRAMMHNYPPNLRLTEKYVIELAMEVAQKLVTILPPPKLLVYILERCKELPKDQTQLFGMFAHLFGLSFGAFIVPDQEKSIGTSQMVNIWPIRTVVLVGTAIHKNDEI